MLLQGDRVGVFETDVDAKKLGIKLFLILKYSLSPFKSLFQITAHDYVLSSPYSTHIRWTLVLVHGRQVGGQGMLDMKLQPSPDHPV